MNNTRSINLNGGGKAVNFPGGIVVFNFNDDDNGQLSQILSGAPGKPIVFISTEFHREMFSQAEGHNRSFILASKFISDEDVDPTYPAQWLAEGDTIPDLPGNVSVTATDRGFRVETLPPDSPQSAVFI